VEWSVSSGLFSSGLLPSLKVLLHLSASSVLTGNQNMISDQILAPSSKYGIIPAPTTPATGRSGDKYSNADSLLPPVSAIASSSQSYPLNPSGSSAAVHIVPSSDHCSSIDEDDIVIAYVFLELRFIALIMLSTRVMGLTGAGKSSVSYRCENTPCVTETFAVH
jgi:hypothetical protein